jgi:hypothetical protein
VWIVSSAKITYSIREARKYAMNVLWYDEIGKEQVEQSHHESCGDLQL